MNKTKSIDMNPDAKRKIKLTLKVNPYEHEKIKKRQTGNTMSAWLRNIALKSMPIAKADPNLIRQIGRIGSNLNQITKLINTNKKIDQQVLKEITAIRKVMDELIESNLETAKQFMNHSAKSDDSRNKVLIVPLAIIFIWFGVGKFNAKGASAIEGMVNNSPILSWAYSIFDVRTFAALLGSLEIIIGLSLLGGLSNSKLRAIGGLGGIATFLTTLSFMLTTPGVVPEDESFPILSDLPGEFLLKDIVLLAVSYTIFTSGRRALTANRA